MMTASKHQRFRLMALMNLKSQLKRSKIGDQILGERTNTVDTFIQKSNIVII